MTRLGVVYAHPIRLKIVTELYMREMSATEFFEEFGGGAKNAVHWHFRQLTDHGWIRKVRTAKTKSGRGRPQDFYRAIELAVIDCNTWGSLPLSIRGAFSQRTLEQLAERLAAALDADTFDSRNDRHLTWISVLLDEQGLVNQMKLMSTYFHLLLQEQADAKVRLRNSGEKPFLMTVALAGFESPLPSSGLATPTRGPSQGTHPPAEGSRQVPWLKRLAKVFVDPLNLRIVSELNLGAMSPSQLAERFQSASVFAVDRRCKMLMEMGWLEKVDEKTGGERRGATEHFYRATGPAVFDEEEWSWIGRNAKRTASATTIKQFWEKVSEALDAGTFDSKLERHLSWFSLLVDQQGWEQAAALLKEYFQTLLTIHEMQGQGAGGGGRGALGTFFLAGFESPSPPTTEQLALY
jgi:DNA-binding transcriptional ArsR family regulator